MPRSFEGDPGRTKLVRITAKEAADLQWDTISKWKPARDVWPFTYGVGILAAASAFVGAYFNGHYRRVTKLGTYGKFATFVPAVIVPSILTAGIHLKYVTSEVLLATNGGPCPVCIEMRAAAIQLAFGLAYPLVLIPFGVFSVASRFYTYRVPPVIPVGYFVRHWWKITKPKLGAINVLLVAHVIAAAAITHAQFASMDKINRKLIDLENRISGNS